MTLSHQFIAYLFSTESVVIQYAVKLVPNFGNYVEAVRVRTIELFEQVRLQIFMRLFFQLLFYQARVYSTATC